MHAVPWVDYYTVTIHHYHYDADVVQVEEACTLLLRRLLIIILLGTTADQTLIQYTDNLMVNREVKQLRGTMGWGMTAVLLLYPTTSNT